MWVSPFLRRRLNMCLFKASSFAPLNCIESQSQAAAERLLLWTRISEANHHFNTWTHGAIFLVTSSDQLRFRLKLVRNLLDELRVIISTTRRSVNTEGTVRTIWKRIRVFYSALVRHVLWAGLRPSLRTGRSVPPSGDGGQIHKRCHVISGILKTIRVSFIAEFPVSCRCVRCLFVVLLALKTLFICSF